jgi:hypothetical protein
VHGVRPARTPITTSLHNRPSLTSTFRTVTQDIVGSHSASRMPERKTQRVRRPGEALKGPWLAHDRRNTLGAQPNIDGAAEAHQFVGQLTHRDRRSERTSRHSSHGARSATSHVVVYVDRNHSNES